jgi:hypothetical protein
MIPIPMGGPPEKLTRDKQSSLFECSVHYTEKNVFYLDKINSSICSSNVFSLVIHLPVKQEPTQLHRLFPGANTLAYSRKSFITWMRAPVLRTFFCVTFEWSKYAIVLHYTRLECFYSDKNSSLVGPFVDMKKMNQPRVLKLFSSSLVLQTFSLECLSVATFFVFSKICEYSRCLPEWSPQWRTTLWAHSAITSTIKHFYNADTKT